METVMEDEEYTYRDVFLPTLIPRIPAPGLERGTVERKRGRDIVIAIDHGPNSKHAFDWALLHLVRLADTLYLVHAVSSYHFLTCFFFFFKGRMPTYQRRSCSMNPTQRYGCSQKGWTGAFWLMGVRSEIVYEASQALMEKLSVEAFQIAMVRTMARIVSGDAGKVICKEAERVKPAAVVMGTGGRSLIQRFAFSLTPSSIHV
ncbi:hypothetical protein Goari_020359 [Gossypium aridum]|uniref:UspA domain-containing protein n=1 Tax=Gossypium aridum TaxID=34290 RepID=A0A7J8YPR4_GOSAI|nr:hypothetical protein [Gossypium aridum]